MITLGHADSHVIIKDAINAEKVKVMNQAIERILQLDALTIGNMVRSFQKEAVDETQRKQKYDELAKQAKQLNLHDSDGFRLVCGKCRSLVCEASDMRLVKNAHHVVVCKAFKDRVVYRPHKKPSFMSDELFKTHKIHCAKCNHDWGVKSTYNGTEVPLLKQGSFIIKWSGENGKMKPLRKWSDCPFSFIDVSLEDMEMLCAEAFPNMDETQ